MAKLKAAAPTKSSSSRGGAIGGAVVSLVTDQLNNPDVQKAVLSWLVGLIGGLFKKKPAPPLVVVTKPEPADIENLDDYIPAPPSAKSRSVKEVRCRLSRVQLQRARFQEAFTAENPFGLVDAAAIQAGDAMNYGSKFWVDLTAYDENGVEIRADAVVALGFQYKTEHHAGEAYIIGDGGMPQKPNPYETEDTDLVGNGITAWISSLGFLHQFKAHAEGQFEVWGSVNGVESNKFLVRVS